MIKKLLTILLLLGMAPLLAQQTIEDILLEIERNNPSMQSMQKRTEASALANRTGIYLQNPTIDYAWFSGSPATIGSKTNLAIMQPFHFPTAYRYMSQVARSRNEQLSTEMAEHRIQLLSTARILILNLVYHQLMQNEWEIRQNHARQLADAWEKMLQSGEASQISYNKAMLHLLNTSKELENIAIQKKALEGELTTLNGGQPISFAVSRFPSPSLETDFDDWYRMAEQKNTTLQHIRQEIEISRTQQQLQKAMNLPSFHAGYASEILANEQFRGISVGITIPLWENKNTLQYARANTLALESEQQTLQSQFYHQLRAMHTKAMALRQYIEEYERLLGADNNTQLLQQAYEMGEIGITEYLLELSYWYQSRDKILESELELHLTMALLMRYVD